MNATVNVPVVGTGEFGPNRLFPLLTEYVDPDGEKWLYAKVSTDLAVANTTVAVNSSGVAAALTKALADAGNKVGVIGEVVDGTPDDAYGWVKMVGALSARMASGCVPGPLYTSGTAGVVDDDASGQTRLVGFHCLTTATSAGAGTSAIIQNNILT